MKKLNTVRLLTGCLFPECKEEGKIRGLCKNHYATAVQLVKAGKTTWKQLETLGKARPPERGKIRAWFLGVE